MLRNPGVLDSARALSMPVLLLRAKQRSGPPEKMDFASSPTWPELANEIPEARDIHFAEHTHFLPMELPGRMAEINEVLNALPVPLRERLLIEYLNELFRRPGTA